MVTQAGTGLARIAVVAPNRRLDLALPEHLPLVGLLPAVLRQADEEPSDGTSHGGWMLRRGDGSPVDLARTLAAQNVRDGETLHLVPRRTEWPELAYDDLMEAVADGARRRGVAWSPFATRLTGLIVAGVLLLLGLVVIVTSEEPGWLGGAVALGAAGLLLVCGIVLSRAMADCRRRRRAALRLRRRRAGDRHRRVGLGTGRPARTARLRRAAALRAARAARRG